MSSSLFLGGHQPAVHLLGQYANRHGLIAGATGTGKTISVQVMAEQFSRLGVPLFLADVKGDLSGIAAAGRSHSKVEARVAQLGIKGFDYGANPARFWDLRGERGHPVRISLSELGPQLLSRLLELNEAQEGVLTLVFEFADNEGLLMLDLNDLKTTLQFVTEQPEALDQSYGRVPKASVSAILRRLLLLEREGAEQFFGEPALDINDLIATTADGQGMINILAAESLIHTPRIYATFLLWLLSELYEQLPEVGDLEKPKFVFFFDEAHLLFNGAPKAFVERVEQVVRLIRSKGVGIYFISQSPSDIPDAVLGQLGNRIQHALRAFTPRDQKAVRVAAQTFRSNPDLDTETVITELGVGEALVSVLDAKGTPSRVERILMRPPCSQIGPLDAMSRARMIDDSPLASKYRTAADPESAHELLQARMKKLAAEDLQQKSAVKPRSSSGSQRQGVAESFFKSVARSIGGSVGRSIVRGILGSILKR
jgi:DNA helicase HerA-like ATPase